MQVPRAPALHTPRNTRPPTPNPQPMLAVQTAEENLLVRESDIASLTPVYPNRTRVVLADGRVAHRPGPPPPGPWQKLHHAYVNPQHLQRQGDHWKDPAGYLYPYQELTQPTEEPEENDLPEGLLTLELQGKDRFWRTDSGLIPCDLDWEQASHFLSGNPRILWPTIYSLPRTDLRPLGNYRS